MIELIAIAAIVVAWFACSFTVLQFVTLGERAMLGVITGTVACGILVIATRGDAFGFAWLREASLRSDALALGVLPATLGTGVGTLASRSTRRSTWGAVTAVVVGIACAVTGLAALAIGRSSWYWEFVDVLVSGALLCAAGVSTALRTDASANTRVVFGGAAAFGAFLMVAGAALLLAWRSIA